jgi:hypothetical protein
LTAQQKGILASLPDHMSLQVIPHIDKTLEEFQLTENEESKEKHVHNKVHLEG